MRRESCAEMERTEVEKETERYLLCNVRNRRCGQVRSSSRGGRDEEERRLTSDEHDRVQSICPSLGSH